MICLQSMLTTLSHLLIIPVAGDGTVTSPGIEVRLTDKFFPWILLLAFLKTGMTSAFPPFSYQREKGTRDATKGKFN